MHPFYKYEELRNKRIPAAVLAKPAEFDAVWDKFQKELLDIGVEKMEAEFTQLLANRVKLWNE